MSEEVQDVVETPAPPPVEAVGDNPPALTAEPTEQPETPPKPERAPEKELWPESAISEVTKLRAKNRERDAELQRLRQEADAARELAERLSRGDKQPAPTEMRAAAADDAEIDRRAEYKIFSRDVNNMRAEGLKEFGSAFQEDIRLLTSYGADDDNFVSQVMSVDPASAHILLHELARNPNRTTAIISMDPIRRVAELTRMSIARNSDGTFASKEPKDAPSASAPKQVSKAPAPPPPVQPTSHKVIEFNSPEADKLPDAEWNKLWDERQAKRNRIRL